MSTGLIKTAGAVAFFALLAGSYLSNAADKANAPDKPGANSSSASARSAGGDAPKSVLVAIKGWFSDTSSTAATPVARQAPAAVPAQPASYGYGAIALKPDGVGQYHANVEISGMVIPMMVDTGATLISLTYEDALKLGYAPASVDFKYVSHTANGDIRVAKIVLREVRLESLALSNVEAIVSPSEVKTQNLLGMSFLKRLGGMQVDAGNLILRQ